MVLLEKNPLKIVQCQHAVSSPSVIGTGDTSADIGLVMKDRACCPKFG
jgi:hypothetical protein